MPERSNGAVSKTVDLPKADPGVRIPLSPHNFYFNCLVLKKRFTQKSVKMAEKSKVILGQDIFFSGI